MSRELSIEALGAVIRIDGSRLSDAHWPAVRAAWQDALTAPAPEAAPAANVTAHGGHPTQSMLSALSIDVTLAALEARAGELLLLHAAGLAGEDGGVVALVGPSGTGKTTASRLLAREFAYLSDESVGIAADGTVLAYRKPLSLIEDDRLPKVQRSPSELGLRPLPSAPLRLAALVLLNRADEVAEPSIEVVDVAEGMAGLAQQASYLGRMPAPLHTLAAHIDAVGGVHRLTYRDASTLVPVIRRLASHRPAATRPAARRDDEHPAAAQPLANVMASIRRAPVLDAIPLEPRRIAVLTRDDDRPAQIVVLDGIAPTLWRHTSQATTVETLVRSVIQEYGDPGDSSAASVVEASITELVTAGVLLRG